MSKVTLIPSLDERFIAIGFRLSGARSQRSLSLIEADIEEVLLAAALEARSDFRILGILLSWIGIHGGHVIVEKLGKKRRALEKVIGPLPVLDLLAAHAALSGQPKWRVLIGTSTKKPIIPIDPEALQSQIKLKGVNKDLKQFGLLLPQGFPRTRESDSLTVKELASLNSQYRNRLLFGASWRADIIGAIELGLDNPSRISKTLGCSYEPAYRVFKEYKIAKSA